MNQEAIKLIRGMMESAGYAIERLNNGTLHSKDQSMLANMIGDIQEEIFPEHDIADNET